MVPSTLYRTSLHAFVARQAPSATSVPQAPPAAGIWGGAPSDGFSPAAIIGIVVAIVGLLIMIPLIAVLLRRYERKRCVEMLPDSASITLRSSNSSVREEQSLKSILVTKEVQRSSIKVEGDLKRPENAYTHERGWSRTEVRGGDWR